MNKKKLIEKVFNNKGRQDEDLDTSTSTVDNTGSVNNIIFI